MDLAHNNQNCIPIVVGVTGHRDLRKEDIPILEKTVTDELHKLQNDYPHSPVWMLNSLAAGADQLCARVALSLGITLYCPLPMDAEEYREDFVGDDLLSFDALRAQATESFVVCSIEPEENSRDFRYRQAGIYVAAHSHVLLALWDGEKGTDHGCGTAEAVDFMLKGNYQDGKLFRASNDGAVLHITTPRTSKEQSFPILVKLLENEAGSLQQVLFQTDQFNRDTQKKRTFQEETLIPKEYLQPPIAKRLQSIYDVADQLSMSWQTRYLRIMGFLSSFSVILVLCYLLYDEAELNLCLIAYGAAITIYGLFFRRIGKRCQQEKYLQYRALAEALRVQLYLHALGEQECVCDNFTWTQKHGATWVKEAVSVLLVGAKETATAPIEVVKSSWIDGQKTYHERAKKRNAKKHHIQEHATRAMITCTLVTWLVVLLLEYLAPNTMEAFFLGYTWRTWFKILWGCLSAVTVFVSGYYGKLSLERKSFDHEKMSALFALAAKEFDANPDNRRELFRQLGREELIENGNWVSYCQENTPDFSV